MGYRNLVCDMLDEQSIEQFNTRVESFSNENREFVFLVAGIVGYENTVSTVNESTDEEDAIKRLKGLLEWWGQGPDLVDLL